jgi:hypothetical protein
MEEEKHERKMRENVEDEDEFHKTKTVIVMPPYVLRVREESGRHFPGGFHFHLQIARAHFT